MEDVEEVEVGCALCHRAHRIPRIDGMHQCPKKRREFRVVFGKVRSKRSKGSKKDESRVISLRARHDGHEELYEWRCGYKEDIEAKSGDDFALCFNGAKVKAFTNLTVAKWTRFGCLGFLAMASGALTLLFWLALESTG